MYYMTKVSPEIMNAVRELVGQVTLQSITEKHWKGPSDTYCTSHIKVLKKPMSFRPYVYVDFDFVADEDNWKSTSAKISMLSRMTAGWCSTKQNTVLLKSFG